MNVLLLVLALAAVTVSAGSAGAGAYSYHGRYPGKCGNDGLYYRDDKSFVFCSNGNSYVQPCAPGSRNSAYGQYSYGGKYDYRDFCDVNLVDDGYAAKHQQQQHYGGSYAYSDRRHAAGPGYAYGGGDYGHGRDYNNDHHHGYNAGYGFDRRQYY